MSISPETIRQYHIFLASPGDVSAERLHVRQFFERYNRSIAQLWNVRFEVVDWENYATIGVGRPQELITQQTLERYRKSLALVVGIMGQRFGSPTGEAESGTEEEFNWAMQSNTDRGFPEIKWFFRKIDNLQLPIDPDEAVKAIEQWKKVLAFRQRMRDLENPVFYTEYPGLVGFRDVFENDLNRWLADSSRPWVTKLDASTTIASLGLSPPIKYFENVERDFHRLDIAGIDNDRTFEIPLSDIYVRLRVIFDEDAPEAADVEEEGPIDIQTALLRYPKLAIVGDPGSGKSTFLKFIALMLARAVVKGDSSLALEKLSLPEPLPLPIFLSCWDLSDFVKRHERVELRSLISFIASRLSAFDYSIETEGVEELLSSGRCCLLFDGLDEVPTDQGRATISRLLEDCVQRYSGNRYVVTSRIRAYTGDTILKGGFARCDIQPFDANDRAEFLRNWVGLLFRISPQAVESDGGEAQREFQSLTKGIEGNDRIRPLAVSPLLLTVIAIVHWNRKRLPEQRVDLYDECVDVLLGQRKEAEHIQLVRKSSALDEQREEDTQEERAWVRKRFAEIALHILSQKGEHDEATKNDLIKLLSPRFIDQGAANDEQAATRAALFLDRQELRSGLLVSRRAQSYRFVHLTFQEYLAAWQLSNGEFDQVTDVIKSRLREAKWFECLQLLGSQWAKESDEKADRYVAWLLEHRGVTINERAPVVALCANIVKDITGIAELKPPTRKTFNDAIKATLAVFRASSGVSSKTQLEILEALGQLGAAVKSHLIAATQSSLFPVRRRAIEMLLPHLATDELFALEHILADRSKEPIKTYIIALLNCGPDRTVELLRDRRMWSSKLCDAVHQLSVHGRVPRELVELLILREHRWWPPGGAIKVLTATWRDDAARQLLCDRAIQDAQPHIRIAALLELATQWPDDKTRLLLSERVLQDEDDDVRSKAISALGKGWSDPATRELLMERAVKDAESSARSAAIVALANGWIAAATRELLMERAVKDAESGIRSTAISALAKGWPDAATRELLLERAVNEPEESAYLIVAKNLLEKWPEEATARLFLNRARTGGFLAAQVAGIHSTFGKLLFTRDSDGISPYLDPSKPISMTHIGQTAERAGLAKVKITDTVHSLSKFMGWDVTRGSAATD